MKLVFTLKKARPVKYIQKIGTGKTAQYIYPEERKRIEGRKAPERGVKEKVPDDLARTSSYLQQTIASFASPSEDTRRLYGSYDLDSIVVGLHAANRIVKRKQEGETPVSVLKKMEKRYDQDQARLDKLKEERRGLTFGTSAPYMGQTKGERSVELRSEIKTLEGHNEGLLLGIMDLRERFEKSLVFKLPLQKAQQKTLTGGHQSDSWDRRLKNLVLVPPPAPLERDLSKETKKNKKKLKEILGTPLDVQYGVTQVPQ